jgi:glutathione peroxidase
MAFRANVGILNHTVTDRFGQPFALSHYAGKVTVIVNIASMCGLTVMNMNELEQLNEYYKGKPFALLAFPCNDFHQEPKNACQVHDWAAQQYKVTFDTFGLIHVKGARQDPLFMTLSTILGAPKWNFHKFLCGKNGIPSAAYSSHTSPMEMIPAIDNLLRER